MPSIANAVESAHSPHVQGVNATSGGLVIATLSAALVAGAILTFVWLPAEYGIDPTGLGHRLGLTEMGQIKEQLHTDAEADAAAALATQGMQAGSDMSEIVDKLDAIQEQLTAMAAAMEATSQATRMQAVTQPVDATDIANTVANSVQAQHSVESDSQTQNAVEPAATWRDELAYTLTPGEGIEVKLVMQEGAVAEFEWSANGAVVNHDTHGDGDGQSISYEKGRSVPEQTGQLIAAFTGNHGWFWRNRTADDVVVTLRTRGEYSGMVLP